MKEKSSFFRSPDGDLSSRRLMGVIAMGAGILLFIALGLCGLLWGVEDLEAAKAAGWGLTGIGAALLGVGTFDHLGKGAFKITPPAATAQPGRMPGGGYQPVQIQNYAAPTPPRGAGTVETRAGLTPEEMDGIASDYADKIRGDRVPPPVGAWTEEDEAAAVLEETARRR